MRGPGSKRTEPDEPHVPGRGLAVADIMTAPAITVPADAPVRTAARTLFEAGIGGAPVVDRAGRLLGVVSGQDLLEKEALVPVRWRGAADALRRHRATTVADICSRPARTATPDESLHLAARRMIDDRVARLVVVDGDAVIGILSRHDVLRALLRDDAEIAADVLAVLAARAAGGLRVRVADGIATLDGVVDLRSQVGEVLGAAELVDGVIEVHGHVRWRRDDVAARAPHPHP
jgi:CBS domain-containing protein